MNANLISPSTEEVKQNLIQAESINLLLLSNFESGHLLTENHIIAALMTIGDLIHESRNQLRQGEQLMNNYLLSCDTREYIYEKLIQVKAIVDLINEVTSTDSDKIIDNINTATYFISENLENILTNIEKLPLQGR